ncbi:MAG: PAS domain S-box protein [Actinomycetota bacterium]
MAGEGLRVLLIEDNEEDADLLLRELRRGGFEPDGRRVATHEQLRAALEGDARWDLAICDWVLPGFSAPDAIRYLEDKRFAGPIVVVSGSMGEDNVVDAMRSGAHDYVLKHNLSRLLPVIRRELREARVRRAVRLAEDALRRQALIFENMSDAVVVADVDGVVIDVNPATERMTGYARDDLVGKQAAFFGAPGGEEDLREAIAVSLAEGGRFADVLPLRRSNASQGSVELVVVPLRDADGELLGSVGVSRDISERVQAEEQLRETIEQLRRTMDQRRQLLSRLVVAQEEERQRIAAEIHDDPVQQLYAAGLRLGMLQERTAADQDREALEQIQQMIGGTIDRLRRMLFELQPRSLDAEGLGAALREYAEYVNPESETRLVLDDRLTTDLSQEIRSVAYRVALEALSNVRRHARATVATVTLSDHDDGLLCTIADDGRGFLTSDRVDAYRPGHLGLPAMRERVELAGGSLEVASAPGEGTTVEFWLPSA